ncbi:MAG: hypothetical protein NC300_02270 [Bacteroidales bacterium]|nr:hypothetical protein [Clostridium sp.]MCM1202950.1 hypothetical protein [Bacteroidales bacterium]
MGVSGQKFDLPQMKDYFENQIPNIRVISDMTLSETDFKSLGAKLKSAFSFTNQKDGMEDIMLCYLVYWVYALIYWNEETGIHDELTDFCAKLPQYQLRHHFQLLLDIFADYNIDDFGYQSDSVEELCSILIARHAGIPNDEKYQVFELIDDYRNQNVSVDTMVADIYAHLPYKSRYIFSLLDNGSRQEMIWEIRTIMAEICSGSCNREQMLLKYPRISVSLIDYCFYWQEGKALLNQAR